MARCVRATARSPSSEQSFLHCFRSLRDQGSSCCSQDAQNRSTRRISMLSACLAFSSRLVCSFTSCEASSTARGLINLPHAWKNSYIYTRRSSADDQRPAWAVLLARRALHTSFTLRCLSLGYSLRSSDSPHQCRRRRRKSQSRKPLRTNNESEV